MSFRSRLRGLAVWALLAGLHAASAAEKPAARPAVQFRTARAGVVSINLYRPDGALVRRLVQMQKYPAGAQKVAWDGLADDGTPVPPGDYTWKGIFHEGVGLKLRGWVANAGQTPWPTPDGKDDWGGDEGVPSAVAADGQQVFLGWSMANQGKSIVACDLDGRIRWGHRRAEGPSGCKALAVDDGKLYVLGGLQGVDAEGGAIYRLDLKDGKLVPWPDGRVDLKISSLWPENSKSQPDRADSMAVRNNRIYLTFTEPSFLSVLEGKTGAYVNTVVGPPPGQIDVVATQTDLPDAPGKLVDADFAVVSLGGGVLGKALFSHDPFWVVISELSPTVRDVRVTALSILGDKAKHHRQMAFVGYGVPFHQVQRRALLDIETVAWTAGRAGGRPLLGPWQSDALRAISGVALDGAGRIWVAEGDEFPKRFSVWDTSGAEGKLVREFIAPAQPQKHSGAINPLDPDIMFAGGCEWRVDRKTGHADCLGVVLRRPVGSAAYGVGANGNAYLMVPTDPEERLGMDIYERVGAGDYKLRASVYVSLTERVPGGEERKTFAWADENGDGEMQNAELTSVDTELRIWTGAVLQDLTLPTASFHGTEGRRDGQTFEVQSWSPCGAPRYNLAKPLKTPPRVSLSADRRMGLVRQGEYGTLLTCTNLEDGRERWTMPVEQTISLQGGSALQPGPIGNVWLLYTPKTPEKGLAAPAFPSAKFKLPLGDIWSLVNEDGFVLAHLFASDPKTIRWPKAAVPGADMSNAVSTDYPARLTQGTDGKLYLQAGATAYWNLEITGLDKVRALPGGRVSVGEAK